MSKLYSGTLILVILLTWVQAQASSPTLTYQGRILKANGDPLAHNSVSFIFQITDPSGNCVLYKEQVNGFDMSNTSGLFDVAIGNGTVSYQTGSSLADVFKNGSALNCQDSGTYTAAATDVRQLKVQFFDGSAWNSITPSTSIRSVPLALTAASADKLGTNVASDFVLKTGIPTCTAGTFLFYDGSSLTCASGGGGGNGTVTNVTSANAYITIASGTTTPALTLNVGTAANTVAAGNDSRIVGALQTGATAGGDLSGTLPSPSVAKLQGSTLTITTPTSGQYLKHNGTAFVNSVLNSSDLSGTIPAANMPAFSGDVSSSAGSTALALGATGTAGTYYKVTTDSKGRVTSGATALVAGDIPNLDWSKITSGLPTTLAGYGVTDGVQNGGGVGKISAGADASKPASPVNGELFVTTDTQKIYRYNGSSWDLVSSAGGTGGTITGVTAGTGLTGGGTSGAVTLNVDAGTSANQIVKLDGSAKLPAVDASQVTNLQASQIPSLSAAKITSGVLAVAQGGTGQSTYANGELLIGNGSTNGLTKATLTAGSGVAVTNGNGSISVSLANGSAVGQVYRWDGTSAWAATKLSYTDLINSAAASPWPASSCTAGQAITWSSATDSFTCTTITVAATQLSGTVAAAQLPAFSGDVTSSAGSVTLTLANSGVTAGTYNSVTVDAKGRVTGGTNPTTLTGYGITDAIANGGGVGKISAGADASKPGSPASGDLFVATDTQKIYRYNGSSWDLVSSAGGTGGTVTSVSGTAPVSVATGTTTPVISLANGSAAGQVYRWDGTSAWAATKLSYTDLINSAAASPWPASSCTAGQAITWSSATDSFTCTTITVAATQLSGTVAAAQLPAFSGDVTSSAGSVTLTLANSGVTAGTYNSVTVDAKGRVTTGANLAAGDITTALGFTPLNKAGDTMSGALTLNAANEVRFADADSSHYVGLRSPATVSANKIWTLPTGDGASGQVLSTDGAGNLGWASGSAQWGTTGNDIYYTTGKVGVGTATPAATLDVNGYAKLKLNTAAPASCSSGLWGSLAMNSGADLCVCKTNNIWTDVKSGSACLWSAVQTAEMTITIPHNNFYCVAEVQVYDENNTNIMTSLTAANSPGTGMAGLTSDKYVFDTTYASHNAAPAPLSDGNLVNCFWNSASASTNNIYIKFGAAKTITRVRVHFYYMNSYGDPRTTSIAIVGGSGVMTPQSQSNTDGASGQGYREFNF